MKKTILFLFSLLCFSNSFAQDCNSYGQAQIDLNVNNIKARILNSGDLWWDGNEGKYIAPVSEAGFAEVTAIFAGALWFGGVDPNGHLKLAAQQYRHGVTTDFYPGPIEQGNSISEDDCENWDRFWVINKSDVESHINDYNDNNIIDNPITSIFSWPGRNNPSFTVNNGFDLPLDHNLAPFFDRDQDGNYNPDQGDYPLIKGEQSIWWVFNDLAGPHRVSQATPMSIEIQAMAYAESSENIHINNATYYDFKVTNQGTDPLLSSYMGLWVDFDLGCYTDDYFGYNEEYQMMYAYNEDDVDGNVGSSCPGGINTYGENIPIIGIKQIGRSDFPVTSFSIFERVPNSFGVPNFDYEYYNILNGRWIDGTAMTYGGNGFDPSSIDTVSYVFNGEPSDDNAWSMCTTDLTFADRLCVMSTKMGSLQPGESFTNSYAVVFVENEDYPCPNLDRLKEAADDVSNNVKTSTININNPFSLQIFPNPAKDILHINCERSIRKIQLLNIGGQILMEKDVEEQTSQYALNINEVSNGLYLISVQDNLGRTSIQKVVVQN